MTRLIRVSFLQFAVFLLFLGSASAQVIYERLPTHCCAWGVGPVVSVATAFSVASTSEVRRISWWGGYASSGTPGDDFTVTIHEDAAGQPGNVLATYQHASVTRSPTGNWVQPPSGSFPGYPEYLFTFTLPAGLILQGSQTYWLDLFDLTTTTAAHLWEMSISDDSGLVALGSGGNWGAPANTVELPAFRLENTPPFIFQFTGFLEPITTGVTNIANAGRSIPVTWRVTDLSGNAVNDPLSFAGLLSFEAACDSDTGSASVTEDPSGSSGLLSLGNGYWRFVWKTQRAYAETCRRMYVKLSDGQMSDQVKFRFH